MKRSREVDDGEVETLAMANCLMLLSRVDGRLSSNSTNSGLHRVFECKTCNRKFHSFQALGGHRASHKRPRLMAMSDLSGTLISPAKPKTHECSICGLEFAIGQALGGHMRRHRADIIKDGGHVEHKFIHSSAVPVWKKSSSKRVVFLDLNLTPYENDLKLGYQMAPLLSGFF